MVSQSALECIMNPEQQAQVLLQSRICMRGSAARTKADGVTHLRRYRCCCWGFRVRRPAGGEDGLQALHQLRLVCLGAALLHTTLVYTTEVRAALRTAAQIWGKRLQEANAPLPGSRPVQSIALTTTQLS